MTQQQQILTALQNNIQSAIDACKIGIELGSDKHKEMLPVFEAQLETVKNAQPMSADEFLKFIEGVNSQLQQVK